MLESLLLAVKLSLSDDCEDATFELESKFDEMDGFMFDGVSLNGVFVFDVLEAGNFGLVSNLSMGGLLKLSFFNIEAADDADGGGGECDRSFFGDFGLVSANACVCNRKIINLVFLSPRLGQKVTQDFPFYLIKDYFMVFLKKGSSIRSVQKI